jgi:hypothetical protein
MVSLYFSKLPSQQESTWLPSEFNEVHYLLVKKLFGTDVVKIVQCMNAKLVGYFNRCCILFVYDADLWLSYKFLIF